MPNYVSAADFANSPEQKAKEQKAFAYQAENPSTSSYMPQANDPGSAAYKPVAYTPSSTSNYTVGGSGGMRNGVSTTAYSDYATANWNNMSRDEQNAWDKQGRNWKDLQSADYLSRLRAPTPTQGLADPAKVGATPQLVTPTNTGQSTATGIYDPRMYSGNGTGGVAPSVMGDGGAKTDTVIKDDRGVAIGYQLASGGFMPVNTGGGNTMGIGSFEQSQFGYPGMPQMSNGTASNAFPVKTPDQIKAEAKARTDALLAKQTTIAGQTKQGFQTSFDRLASTTKDDRTLQDAAFFRNNAPPSISGGTGYKMDMTGREREISDRQAQQDLQTRLANVDLSLADYTNATDAQRMQMETDMTNAERAYGMQVDQYNLQRQGQNFNQGIQMAGITGKYNGQDTMQQTQNNFNNGIAQAGLTGKYNGQDTLAGRQTDSSIAAQQAGLTGYMPNGQRTLAGQTADQQKAYQDNTYNLQLRQQHINEAADLSNRFGIQVQPKDDYQLMLDQVAGLPTVANQTAEAKKIADQKSEAWKVVELLGTVPEAYAPLLGIPAGTQTQKAKELAMDSAFKNRSANTSDYNAQTSRFTAEQNAANIAFDNKIAASKYELDQLKTGEEKDAAIAKLLDSSPLLQKSYDSRGNVVGNKVADADKKQMEQYIANLGLPAAEAKKWFIRYGLWSDSGN